jgi:FemAB-related protein (PEP-CTERM system-associated)
VGALAAHAADLARDSGADLLELRSRRPLELGLAVSRRKITVTLSLPLEGSELLWESLKAKVRSQVRRPGKEGVEARFGHDTATDFYTVFARNMRDLGTPVMPRTFFEGIADVFGEDVWFGCAYLGGRPVAAGAGFRWDDEFEMTWASSLKECNRIAANMLLYWSFMERCVEQGMKTFNFGRCTPGSGTHRFKQQWGGADEQLWWYQWSPKGIVTTPSAENGAYGLTRRVWRVLPVGLTRLLGPAIVSRIP